MQCHTLLLTKCNLPETTGTFKWSKLFVFSRLLLCNRAASTIHYKLSEQSERFLFSKSLLLSISSTFLDSLLSPSPHPFCPFSSSTLAMSNNRSYFPIIHSALTALSFFSLPDLKPRHLNTQALPWHFRPCFCNILSMQHVGCEKAMLSEQRYWCWFGSILVSFKNISVDTETQRSLQQPWWVYSFERFWTRRGWFVELDIACIKWWLLDVSRVAFRI